MTEVPPTADASTIPDILDARLLPAALTCWLITIAVLTTGWHTGVVLAVLALVMAAVLTTARNAHIRIGGRHRVKGRGVVGVVLAALVLGAGFAGAAAWREYRVDRHPLRGMVGESVRVVVQVADDPKAVRGSSFGSRRLYVVRAGLVEFRGAGAEFRGGGAVVILGEGEPWSRVVPGARVEFRARVQAARFRDLTVVTLRAMGPPRVVDAPPWWQRAAMGVRADLADAARRALPERAAGLLPALVVGDTSALPDSVRAHFDTAGLTHLCVVSGANFAILLSAVLFGVRRLTVGPKTTAGIAAVALIGFVVVARPDPSVLRAAAMGSVTLLAVLTGRRKQALPALCAAVIGLLAWHPALAMSPGFALSVIATGGLILVAPSWVDGLRARGWRRLPAELLAVSASAFVVTVPLMIALTGKIALVAVLANLLVAPVIAPITVLGALAAATAWLWPPFAVLLLHLAEPPLWWLLTVAERAAALPGASVNVPGGTTAGIVAALLLTATLLLRRATRASPPGPRPTASPAPGPRRSAVRAPDRARSPYAPGPRLFGSR
ncbi:ComEC/Rec2 family competence protein [Nocardia takedensis]|uniref:ComEC/Rec2 family competence protein n=1 Tax=Nocardia takedensis TaxID=259390 RepID=UPI0002F90233|nr:ComEC/Rec2 family competence protein [Nocardia takedensis]